MKRLTLVMTLVSLVIWSCDDDSKVVKVVKVQDQLVGQWEFSFGSTGSEYLVWPGPAKYDFHANMSFIKNYQLAVNTDNVRDEGTWTYVESDKTLILTYKTYDNQHVSDIRTATFIIHSITGDELVLKAEYNDTNFSGQFVEFQYIYFLKK